LSFAASRILFFRLKLSNEKTCPAKGARIPVRDAVLMNFLLEGILIEANYILSSIIAYLQFMHMSSNKRNLFRFNSSLGSVSV
jgi:hypothetical protein